MDRKCALLERELRRLPAVEVKEFAECERTVFFRAYTWDLWAAASLMAGGCGDDSFMDFRNTLISMGRKVFERALVDADSLAEVDFSDPIYEGYGYVPGRVYEELIKQQGVSEEEICEEEATALANAPRHPEEPAGMPFQEWDLEARFPKLAAKYSHEDANYKGEQERTARLEDAEARVARLADLLLDSGIVPSCGFVPPFRVVAKVLGTGRSPAATGREYSWEPFELYEGDFWNVVRHLEKLTPEQVRRRPDLREGKVQLDSETVANDDYALWLAAIRQKL